MSQEWDAGRLDSDLDGVAFDTLAVRAGQHRTPEGEHGDPMFFTSSYVFRTAADAAARFAGEVPGNVYSRYTNPTVRAFEERIAALEGAEQAVATATGMAAILAVLLLVLRKRNSAPLLSVIGLPVSSMSNHCLANWMM